MKQTRRKFTRDFKITIIREIEGGKSMAEVCREHNLAASLVSKWRKEYAIDPEASFKGNGNVCTLQGKVSELERLVGKLYAENDFLKKTLSFLEKMKEEDRKIRKME